jgi:hypothetical protein
MAKLEEPVTLFFFAMTTSPSLIERHLERITINELFDLYSNDGSSTLSTDPNSLDTTFPQHARAFVE